MFASEFPKLCVSQWDVHVTDEFLLLGTFSAVICQSFADGMLRDEAH
jgi:hypothetical protein